MGAPRIDRLDRNFLINGSFRYFQRGTNIAIPGIGYTTADRWRIGFNVPLTSAVSFQSQTIPSGGISKHSLTLQATVSGTGGDIQAQQRIENIFARDLVLAGKMSFSVQVASDSASLCDLDIRYATAEDNFASVTPIITQTFSITPDGAGGTIFTTLKIEDVTIPPGAINGLQVQIRFYNFLVNGAGKVCRIYQPMLNAGSIALSFNHAARDLAEEFRLCERYFLLLGKGITGVATSASNISMNFTYPVEMRTVPGANRFTSSISFDEVGFGVKSSTSAFGSVNTSTDGAKIDMGGFSGMTAGHGGVITTDDCIAFDAEL